MPVQCICKACGRVFPAHPKRIAKGWGNYCTHACRCRASAQTPKALYEARVIRTTEGCWDWSGAVQTDGYGYFKSNITGRPIQYLAHRFALADALGCAIPRGWQALHTCDNPICSNTDEPGIYVVRGIARPRFGHLWLGTQRDNVADMVEKQRGWWHHAPPPVFNCSGITPPAS